jgi:hypothetical protein
LFQQPETAGVGSSELRECISALPAVVCCQYPRRSPRPCHFRRA